jgi:hypothetical protein
MNGFGTYTPESGTHFSGYKATTTCSSDLRHFLLFGLGNFTQKSAGQPSVQRQEKQVVMERTNLCNCYSQFYHHSHN